MSDKPYLHFDQLNIKKSHKLCSLDILSYCMLSCWWRRGSSPPWAWWSISSDAAHHIFTGREWGSFARISFLQPHIIFTLVPFFDRNFIGWGRMLLLSFIQVFTESHLEPKLTSSLKWSNIYWHAKSAILFSFWRSGENLWEYYTLLTLGMYVLETCPFQLAIVYLLTVLYDMCIHPPNLLYNLPTIQIIAFHKSQNAGKKIEWVEKWNHMTLSGKQTLEV